MLAALANAALAFTVQTVPGSDEPVQWATMPQAYEFADDHRLPPGSAQAVDLAFEAWSHVDGSKAGFETEVALDPTPVASYDDQQVVFLATEWPYGSDALAITSVWSDEASGQLFHFDIRLNPTVDWAVDGDDDCFDLESAVTHEVGHVLGLEHTEVDEAAMFAVLGPGYLRRGLHDDDEEGLRFLYPDTGDDGVHPMGCSTVPGSAGWLLVGIALAAGHRRGRP